MGAMETLYKVCTGLGTTIFALIFLNYYLEGKEEVDETGENKKDKKKKEKKEKGKKRE